MSGAHTPGPWRYVWSRPGVERPDGTNQAWFGTHTLFVDKDGYECLDSPDSALSLSGYCTEANARLIAAAPDLLEVAKTLASLESDDNGRSFPTKAHILLARAAIGKATGGDQ